MLKKLTVVSCATILSLGWVSPSYADEGVNGVPIDISGSTMTVLSSDTMRLNNIQALGGTYWGEFTWNGSVFRVSDYGPEGPATGFLEDFNDGIADNWVDDGSGAWSVTSGIYRADAVDSSSVIYYSHYNDDFADFTYGVDVRRTSGSDGKSMGMIFRGDGDYYNGYVFHIIASGSYLIYSIVNGSYTWLIPGWTPSDALNTGLNAWNRLEVDVSGSSMEFSINGTVVETLSDSSLASGQAGIKAYGSAPDGDVVDFDNAELVEGASIMGTPKPALAIPATQEATEVRYSVGQQSGVSRDGPHCGPFFFNLFLFGSSMFSCVHLR